MLEEFFAALGVASLCALTYFVLSGHWVLVRVRKEVMHITQEEFERIKRALDKKE